MSIKRLVVNTYFRYQEFRAFKQFFFGISVFNLEFTTLSRNFRLSEVLTLLKFPFYLGMSDFNLVFSTLYQIIKK